MPERLYIIYTLRKSLSGEGDIPLEIFFSTNIVPAMHHYLNCLVHSEQPNISMIREILWILMNLASGERNLIDSLYDPYYNFLELTNELLNIDNLLL